MKINIKNTEKLNSEIKKAEGKATARLLTVDDIRRLLAGVEKQLSLTKAELRGVIVRGCPAGQDFPNAYGHTPYATCFTAEYCSSGWCVTEIERDRCPRWKDKAIITLTDAAKDAILYNMTRLSSDNMPSFPTW